MTEVIIKDISKEPREILMEAIPDYTYFFGEYGGFGGLFLMAKGTVVNLKAGATWTRPWGSTVKNYRPVKRVEISILEMV